MPCKNPFAWTPRIGPHQPALRLRSPGVSRFTLPAVLGIGCLVGLTACSNSGPNADQLQEDHDDAAVGTDATADAEGDAPLDSADPDLDADRAENGKGEDGAFDGTLDGRQPTACDPMAMPTPHANLEEQPGEGGCPVGMIQVDDQLCIDKFEAALAVVETDGSLTPWSPFFAPGERRIRALSLASAIPQAYLSADQAASACAEAGKRLCSDDEWLQACQGTSANVFPYGKTRQDGLCNDGRAVHPAVSLFGDQDGAAFSMLDNPCLNQLPDSLTKAGAHQDCLAEHGAFDLMGNLQEWTSNPGGVLRGGSYVDTRLNGEGCLYATTAHPRSHRDFSTGFRCCADR